MKGVEPDYFSLAVRLARQQFRPEPKPDPETDREIAARNEAILLPVIAEGLQDPRRI